LSTTGSSQCCSNTERRMTALRRRTICKHTIETNKLELMQPVVVKSLRKLLIDIRTGRSSLHSDDLRGPPSRVGNDDGLDEGDPPGRDRHGVRRLEQWRRLGRRLH